MVSNSSHLRRRYASAIPNLVTMRGTKPVILALVLQRLDPQGPPLDRQVDCLH
jgi:hypothetical protein